MTMTDHPIALHRTGVAVQHARREAAPQVGPLTLVHGLRRLAVAPRRGLLEEDARQVVGPDRDERLNAFTITTKSLSWAWRGAVRGPATSASVPSVFASYGLHFRVGRRGQRDVAQQPVDVENQHELPVVELAHPHQILDPDPAAERRRGLDGLGAPGRSPDSPHPPAHPSPGPRPSTSASTITMQVRFVIAVGARPNCSARSTTAPRCRGD